MIPRLVDKNKWTSMRGLFNVIITDSLKQWADGESSKEKDLIFLAVNQGLKIDISQLFDSGVSTLQIRETDEEDLKSYEQNLWSNLPWSTSLSRVLFWSLLRLFCKMLSVGADAVIASQTEVEPLVADIFCQIRSCFEKFSQAAFSEERVVSILRRERQIWGSCR
jgi:hypothetical protein